MKKALLLTVLFALFATLGFSQTGKYWSSHTDNGKIITDKAVGRLSYPKVFKLFNLDLAPLKNELFTVTDNNQRHTTVITLPNADGQMEDFEVNEASNFEPALQALYPQIRAFSGRGLTDKAALLKISLSPQGIQTMIFRADKPAEFIEPYSADHSIYSVYASQRTAGSLPWACSTDEKKTHADLSAKIQNSNFTESSTGQLKTMRLAQSVTAEYANYFGATTAAQSGLVLAAVNATLTRCNGCYEKDLGIHLNLIANTTAVFYYDPSTDPYDPSAQGVGNGTWNAQLMNTLHSVIGDANFDIGHLFGATGGGGNAGCIGCICSNDMSVDGSGSPNFYKGSGITSPADGIPQGDNFDIDYVVHEVGHQMGANHTFSFQNEGTGVNKEVGSGITIMGYAGITPWDVAPHSIDAYHEASIAQIQTTMASVSCPVTTSITVNNATPVVAAVNNYTIPITTPFALTGSATDANAADVLTYSWEQNDNATVFSSTSTPAATNKCNASPTKATGPNWTCWLPTTSPTRLCPKLGTILTGGSTTAQVGGDANMLSEALSSVARTLNFRLTVRDNHPYSSTAPVAVGQTSFTDMVVTVSSAVGPFLISSQNSAVSYVGGSTQTVTWDVAGTTGAPTNTANVKISWSTDGGNTFNTLVASTANDGTENITIPATATTTGRVKVEAIGNIYFDINNANITVTTPTNDFAFGTPTTSTTTCPSGVATVSIPTSVIGTFTTPIALTSSGAPAGTTVTFVPNPLTPGSAAVATLNNANTLTAGTYNITVTGTAGAQVHTTTITYVISAGTGPVISTQPTAQTVCAPAAATFTSATAAVGVTYKWQSAPTIGGVYTDIAGATGQNYSIPVTTAAMNGMGFHVIISTQCGSTTSNNALLTVNTAASITTPPTNQSACTGNPATFTVTGAGTGVTYQWQSATAAGGPYTPIAGATSSTYTIPSVTGATPGFYNVVLTTTLCAATVTSGNVTLTINTTTAINTQPTAQTVCAPAAATFTVAAVGTGAAYQWQVSTAAVPAYTSIAGANSASYNTGATTAAMSGNSYHVMITGTCNTVTSNNVTLTVNTAAAITGQPGDVTVCNGTSASFTVTASGTGATYQWQSATAVGGPYTPIAGAVSATYTIGSTTPAMNNTYYEVVVTTTSCAGTVTSTAAHLTVNTVATITAQPTSQSACVPNAATFTVAATGTGLTYQWQVSTAAVPAFTDIAGATSATYTINPTAFSMNGNQYRVQILSTCSPTTPTTSNAVTLTVNNPVSVTQNPQNQRGCAGDNFTFSVTAVSTGSVTYQWQVSADGGVTYTNVASGGTASTYTVTNAPIYLNGFKYRVIVSGVPCGVVTTPGASLTLGYHPAVILAAQNHSTLDPSTPSVLTATVSPSVSAGNIILNWTKNGVTIPNTTTTTAIPITVDDFGTYQVTATDATTGCSTASNIVVVDSAVSHHLFIYPNPVTTTMQVRYYSSNPAARGTMLNIFDSKGARVYAKEYTAVTGTYGRMDVDMTGMPTGTYEVELRDASGKKLASATVLKSPY